MLWNDLRGHHEQVAMLRRAVQRGRTAHAYLFVGPSGIGKRLVARRTAQALLCERRPDVELDACGDCPQCRQVIAGSHPDVLTVALLEGKRELTIAQFAGTRESRGREGLCHDLSLRPMLGTRRIAIIDDADLMNEESSNSLLKTLEEPPPGAILFLISSSTDALLPTIRSRCQPLLFSRLSDQEVADLLISIDPEIDATSAAEAARLSEGSLDIARQLLEPGLRQLRHDLHASLLEHPFHCVETANRMLKGIEEIGGGPAGQRENATWLVRFSADFFRQAMHESGDAAATFRRNHPAPEGVWFDRLTLALDRCLDAAGHLEQSMPLPLCLESLFFDISRILRGSLVLTPLS